jgi:hypothetical protein
VDGIVIRPTGRFSCLAVRWAGSGALRWNQLVSIGLFNASANTKKVSVDDRPTGGASGDERRASYP